MEHERIQRALLGSLRHSMSGHHKEGLEIMDDLIAEAIMEGEEPWVFIFINHASVLNASGVPDQLLLKHYYNKYLAHSPENPRALYGLADVAMKEDENEIAEQYAKRCHRAILQSNDAKVKKDLLDLVLERWPQSS